MFMAESLQGVFDLSKPKPIYDESLAVILMPKTVTKPLLW